MELLARTCNTESMNVERLVARMFVVGGGAFWVIAAFGADFSYRDQSLVASVGTAMVPLAITLVALGIGWFYEKLAAAVLVAGTFAAIAWGVIGEWETGVWLLNAVFLMSPMVIAALLFLLASRMQTICTLQRRTD